MQTVTRMDWGDRYGYALCAALAAFAIAGKGFAYLGAPPIYVTEMLLAAGILMFLQTRCMLASLLTVPSLVLAVLMLLTVVRTSPYVPRYGIDALRDSVLVLYGLFAFVTASLLLQRPERLVGVIAFLRWFTGMFVFVGPAVYILSTAASMPALPELPGSGIPILSVRAGELGVHLAGCTVMALVGLRPARPVWLAALLLGIMLVASQNRGGFLAILLPVLFALPFSAAWRRVLLVVMAGAVVLGLGYAVDLEMPSRAQMERPLGERPLGARQVVNNVLSLAGSSENRQLDDTKAFRVMWWQHIRNYTIGGQYFWTGKGFGVNLAVDDGFELGNPAAPRLRSPHNSHMNILARTGVPGIILWGMLLITWFATVMGCALRAWRNGDTEWGSLLLFAACYWLANVVNASFDVALEGPMLGVWFWCQTGFGLGVAAIYRGQSVAAPLPAYTARHAYAGEKHSPAL